MADKKVFEQELYKETSGSIKNVVNKLPTYAEIMKSFGSGENEVELKKRFMLKKLDETWITAIEDALPALDQIIRNPQFRLQEKEEVLPVEISKHINGRSVMHLSQHTDMINEVKDDGSVVPSKLLNVFQEDTVLTYENKFINTLVNRVYAFVAIRYNGAKECGEDEKQTILNLKQDFEHDEFKGKINISIEIDQAPGDHEVIKNYVYTSDLWKRMEKINSVVNEYMNSPFVINMGKNFIHPPVLRTNTIMKNPLFKDCLSLWEFIEGYENTGYEAMVQEDLITASDELLEDMYNSIAEQYVLFQTHILNGFEDEKALDSRLLKVNPRIKDEFDSLNENEFDYKTLIPGILKSEGPLEYPDTEIEMAIKVALAADAMMWQDEVGEVETVLDEKGDILYRYKYSFIARLIKAQLPTQDYYNEIRNDLLSYEGVKSLLSWSRDLYKFGRKPVAKLNVKGKTLFVYLPLDPKQYDASHYHHVDVSKEDKEVDYPFLLKVRSPRACRYAKELIASILEGYGVTKNEKYKAFDYHLPEMSLEELLERDLARPLDKNGPWSFDWDLTKKGFDYKYIYSFTAKLIRSGEERQEFYNEIKNYILSFKSVKSSISWPRELFRSGRNKVSQFKVKGKTLCVYLPLNASDFDVEHFHHEDVSVEGKENEFGLMIRIKSNLAVKHVKELIDVVMANLGLERIENYEIVDYKFKDRSLPEMLAEDLVRLVGQKAPEKEKIDEVAIAPIVGEQNDNFIEYKYIFSYSARLIRSGDDRQDLYNAMKNEVLSYKKVNSKISWSHELFKLGRNKLALFKIKGKTLCVYLPLNPDKYDPEHYHFKDERQEGKEVEFPLMMRITSMRAVKYTAELIKDVMDSFNIVKDESYVEANYKLPYMSIEQMLTSDPVLAKLVKGEPIVKPQVVEIEAKPVVEPEQIEEDDSISYKYKFSFSARLIRSGDERQEFYNAVKNNILSYKKVNSKISWSHEFFKLGRIKIALLKVKGKTLCVYLPLNPDNYDQDRLHFIDLREEAKEVEFPMMMKVKSDRAVKYVAELIQDVMANNNIVPNENYEEQDYKLPYMSIEQMLSSDPVLAKLIVNAEVPFDITKPEENSSVNVNIEETKKLQNVEIDSTNDSDEEDDAISYKYKFSFSARLIRAGMLKQDFYNEIKNELLSYKKVNSKISWSHEFFKLGRKKCALLKVKGKTLCVYLPLNPDNYDQDRLHFIDLREEAKEVEFPMLMKVKSDRAVKYVKELIVDVMKNYEIEKDETYQPSNFRMKEISIEKMLTMEPPLAKLVENANNPFENKENENEDVLTESLEIEETPTIEEATPVEEEPTLIEETPVIEESPSVNKDTVVEETPVVEESPSIEESTTVEEETPIVEEEPLKEEESPAIEEQPIFEESQQEPKEEIVEDYKKEVPEMPFEEQPIEEVPEQPQEEIVEDYSDEIEETLETPIAEEVVEQAEEAIEIESYDEDETVVSNAKEVASINEIYDDDYEEPGFNVPLKEAVNNTIESYDEETPRQNSESYDDEEVSLSDLMKVNKK